MKVEIHCEIQHLNHGCYWFVLVEEEDLQEVFVRAKKLWIECLDDVGAFYTLFWDDKEIRAFIENRINTAFQNFQSYFTQTDEVSVNLPFGTILTLCFLE